MKHLVWEMEYLSPPPVWRHCQKCKGKKLFQCSGRFRVNAQRKTLDIWLIYKCSDCGATWNATIYSRVSPQSLDPALLEAFHHNDRKLAERFAMDAGMLQRNGAETGLPLYTIAGADFSPDEAVTLVIQSKYNVPIKVSAILRKKLHLSHKDILCRIAHRRIRSIPEQDLRCCKLNGGIILLFGADL